ncbi:MAG: DUF2007 domain-containing protein [Desulfohalobiaceae bacterium]
MPRHEHLVTVKTFLYPWEADLARSALEAAGIPAYVRDAETVSLNWFLSNALGGVRVQVPGELADKAREVLEATAEDVAWPDPDEQPLPTCPRCGSASTTAFRGRWWLPFLSWFLADLLLLSRRKRRRCRRCGHTWTEETPD